MPDNIQTFYAFPQNEPYVNADEYHLTEVFKNIIANAVSALHKREAFRIRLSRSKELMKQTMEL